jgi:hypothetical protein
LAGYPECLTYNLCAVCRQWKSEFLVLFQLEASALPGVSWYAFLGRVVGEGKLTFLSCANFLAQWGSTSRTTQSSWLSTMMFLVTCPCLPLHIGCF